MLAKGRWMLVLLLGAAALVPLRTVFADAPPPSMTFQFVQGVPGQQLTPVSGTLFACNRPDCQDTRPVTQLTQGNPCSGATCEVMVYPPLTYYRLRIQFSDGKSRQSNVFRAQHWFTTYKVTIRPDDLLVQLQSQSDYSGGPSILDILAGAAIPAVCCLILIAGVVGVILLNRGKKSQAG